MQLYIAFHGMYNNNNEHRQVASFAEASKVWSELRDREEIGGSDMLSRCGNVYDDDGKKLGHISYNGRAWDADGNAIDVTTPRKMFDVCLKTKGAKGDEPLDKCTVWVTEIYVGDVQSAIDAAIETGEGDEYISHIEYEVRDGAWVEVA